MQAHKTLIRYIQTEKSSALVEDGRYSFQVHPNSSKTDIKIAIERFYGVKALAVNTIMVKGKVKNYRGRRSKRPDWKKAIVKLAPGQSIEYTTFKVK